MLYNILLLLFIIREGILGLAQTLCAFGCNVDLANEEGMLALHLAAKHGHTEVIMMMIMIMNLIVIMMIIDDDNVIMM